MRVECPKCQVLLRPPQMVSNVSVQVSCPRCLARFRLQNSLGLNVLIAHEDDAVCRQLNERLGPLLVEGVRCHTDAEVFDRLKGQQRSVLLLDVAFNGNFPFRLIDSIKNADRDCHKVVLLPSVYNRTAYKKRPESLYGADAYLELHHIGDRLWPLLAELFPDLGNRLSGEEKGASSGAERSVREDDVKDQADGLAKLLVADILLYHQDLLERGLESGELAALFGDHLAEGRRILASRLPASKQHSVDFIQQAFDAACQSYSCR